MTVNLKQDIKPISYIKTNAADMMRYVNENQHPIIITQNGEAKAVLIDIESYQKMLDAFSLLNLIKIAERDVENNRMRKADEVFQDLRKKLK